MEKKTESKPEAAKIKKIAKGDSVFLLVVHGDGSFNVLPRKVSRAKHAPRASTKGWAEFVDYEGQHSMNLVFRSVDEAVAALKISKTTWKADAEQNHARRMSDLERQRDFALRRFEYDQNHERQRHERKMQSIENAPKKLELKNI